MITFQIKDALIDSEERLEEISVKKTIFIWGRDGCPEASNIMFFHKSYMKIYKFEEAASMKKYQVHNFAFIYGFRIFLSSFSYEWETFLILAEMGRKESWPPLFEIFWKFGGLWYSLYQQQSEQQW